MQGKISYKVAMSKSLYDMPLKSKFCCKSSCKVRVVFLLDKMLLYKSVSTVFEWHFILLAQYHKSTFSEPCLGLFLTTESCNAI